jgi:hypothetical protein
MGKNPENGHFLNKKRHQTLSVLPENTLDDIGLRLGALPLKSFRLISQQFCVSKLSVHAAKKLRHLELYTFIDAQKYQVVGHVPAQRAIC